MGISINIMSYKKYTKKDFLDYASGFNYQIDIDEGNITGFKTDDEIKQSMKKWKLKEFQDFYDFTHKDINSGRDLNVNNFEYILCRCCANHYRPDEASQRDRRYCIDCYE